MNGKTFDRDDIRRWWLHDSSMAAFVEVSGVQVTLNAQAINQIAGVLS
jgi:hypothetical protein